MLPRDLAETDTSPQTTPDDRTGLTKRVSLRKARNSGKQISPTRVMPSSPPGRRESSPAKTMPSSPPMRRQMPQSSLPGSPQLEDSFGESRSDHYEDEDSQGASNASEQDDSRHDLPPHRQGVLVSEADYSLPHASHPNVNFTDEDIGVMHQRFGQTSTARPYRNFSAMTNRTMENEQLEEIDPSFLMDMSNMRVDEGIEEADDAEVDPHDDTKITEHGSSDVGSDVDSSGSGSVIVEEDNGSGQSDGEFGGDGNKGKQVRPSRGEFSAAASRDHPTQTRPHSSGSSQSTHSRSSSSPSQQSSPEPSRSEGSHSPASPRSPAETPPPHHPLFEMPKRKPPRTEPQREEEPKRHSPPRDPLGELLSDDTVQPHYPDDIHNDYAPAQVLDETTNSALPAPNQNFDLSKFKKSGLARRVSISTPSTQSSRYTTNSQYLGRNPPSMLGGSEYQFSLEPSGKPHPMRQEWDREGSTVAISPISEHDSEGSVRRTFGSAPAANSTQVTPIKPREDPGFLRNRSKSDPLDQILGSGYSDDSKSTAKPVSLPIRVNQQLASPDNSRDDHRGSSPETIASESPNSRQGQKEDL